MLFNLLLLFLLPAFLCLPVSHYWFCSALSFKALSKVFLRNSLGDMPTILFQNRWKAERLLKPDFNKISNIVSLALFLSDRSFLASSTRYIFTYSKKLVLNSLFMIADTSR